MSVVAENRSNRGGGFERVRRCRDQAVTGGSSGVVHHRAVIEARLLGKGPEKGSEVVTSVLIWRVVKRSRAQTQTL
jgi:hypothetical protein